MEDEKEKIEPRRLTNIERLAQIHRLIELNADKSWSEEKRQTYFDHTYKHLAPRTIVFRKLFKI